MALEAKKKHPSTDIKEGELIFSVTDTADTAVGYVVAGLKVANISDPVAIVYDPRTSFNPSKKFFYRSQEYLETLGIATALASKFANNTELGSLKDTVVTNIFGSDQTIFTGTNATDLGDTTITTVTKITDSSVTTTTTTDNPGTANASTDTSSGFFSSIPVWGWFLIVPAAGYVVVWGLKQLFGGKKKAAIKK